MRYRKRFVLFLTIVPAMLFMLVKSPVQMVVAGGIAQALMLPIQSDAHPVSADTVTFPAKSNHLWDHRCTVGGDADDRTDDGILQCPDTSIG